LVKDVGFYWYDYGSYQINGRFGSGSISSIEVSVTNNGTATINPVFDVTVKKSGYVICSENNIEATFSRQTSAGTEVKETLYMDCEIDSRGTYEIKVDLKDVSDDRIIIATDYEYVTASKS